MNEIMEPEQGLEKRTLTSKEKKDFIWAGLDIVLKEIHEKKTDYTWEELREKSKKKYRIDIGKEPNERGLYEYVVLGLESIDKTLDKRMNFFTWW